jgi:hypothetical protein
VSYSSTVLADSPAMYYRLDEASGTLHDSSGNARDMNNTPSTGETFQVPGAITDGNFALQNDGTSRSPAATSLPTISGSWSVECWVKPNSTTGWAMLGSRSPSDHGFDMQVTSTKLHCDVGDGTNWLSTAADATFTFVVGTWYHCVFVATGSGYTIYINGVSQATGSWSGTPLVTDSNHNFILLNDGAGDPSINGVLDEVAVYTTALTATQVLAHYNAGRFSSAGSHPINQAVQRASVW